MVSIKFNGSTDTYSGTSFDFLKTIEVPEFASGSYTADGYPLQQLAIRTANAARRGSSAISCSTRTKTERPC